MHKILLCIFFWWITIFLFSAFCTIKIVGVCLGWGVNCNLSFKGYNNDISFRQ